ncbi:MAG: DUF4900 domain-containing protein [Deltaproteobacteria bacterium]|nr:DUF4900 domain-containing protein [Deltaproteobacteria bacterium]
MKKTFHNQGSAILVATFLILLIMTAGIAFLSRSTTFMAMTGLQSDNMEATYQMEAAYEQALSKIKRAMAGVTLNSRLQYVNTNGVSPGPAVESFANINNTYGTNSTTALNFLKSLVLQQACTATGTCNSSAEFGNFNTAFPTTWTDPDSTDDQYFEVKYSFDALPPVAQLSSVPYSITFDYEYRVQVRGYGRSRFTNMMAEDNGILSVSLSQAPFSQWAILMNSMKNQLNQTLVFVGGNTSAQIQEVYGGKVHVNDTPYFYGHPVFKERFTSTAATSSWYNYNVTNYSCCAVFDGGSAGSAPAVSIPSQIYNTARLAAGDTSTTAGTNNNAPTGTELATFVSHYAGGDISGGATSISNGIYVPIDNQTSKIPTGGIYVEGDARIAMDVVTGSTGFTAAQWAQVQSGHQGCKFQKYSITSLTAGVTNRDIFVGAGSCYATYVFNTTTPATSPAILNGRINGNLHVNGKIDQLGGASRSRPAVAQDFGLTISALKDVRIINDLQYEDIQYKTVNSSGTIGSSVVANAYGAVGGSGVSNTAQMLSATIDSSSKTILGVISTQRNIMLHSSAPANINLQGAFFAGNSAAFNSSTGLGCGSTYPGCGFGYESYSTATNMGNIKMFGGLTEYRDQTTGTVSSSTTYGYGSLNFFDTRMNTLSPPAFPVTSLPTATGTVNSYRTWRISSNAP